MEEREQEGDPTFMMVGFNLMNGHKATGHGKDSKCCFDSNKFVNM